jgi:E1A/CREB-binding protein
MKKPKLCKSFLKHFTSDDIIQQIISCRIQHNNQKNIEEKHDFSDSKMGTTCNICGQGVLLYEPLPLYCTECKKRIKKDQVYWTLDQDKTKIKPYICSNCYRNNRKTLLIKQKYKIAKASLSKKRIEIKSRETLIKCNLCMCWSHEICSLSMKNKNKTKIASHCPHCLLERFCVEATYVGVHTKLEKPIEAKELPTCFLSDFLEERVNKLLRITRDKLALKGTKPLNKVPEVNEIVIRVVNSTNKKCHVKPRFLETFKTSKYPPNFGFKQKVLLLFQKIEGFDVMLFCMYVQEYGNDCLKVNKRTVYLSYLDSVKHFIPEVESTENGIYLRSIVYHEIIIGYMDYIKGRGFNEMFIWACPSFQGDDYIFYCHPGIPRVNRPANLCEWYLIALMKAQAEGIVYSLTNLFKRYFNCFGKYQQHYIPITDLPYFDGDYWPEEAESHLENVESKIKFKPTSSSIDSKDKSKIDCVLSKSKILMTKLESTISPIQSDFMLVNFSPNCSFCREYFTSTKEKANKKTAWVYPNSQTYFNDKKFYDHFWLCSICYRYFQHYDKLKLYPEYNLSRLKYFPAGLSIHDLVPREIFAAQETHDPDKNFECDMFESRSNFLSLCQENHYQFETLRRSKYSTLMVLNKLFNPHERELSATCNNCCRKIESGDGWRCQICNDYDLCHKCNILFPHDHSLIHPSSPKFPIKKNEMKNFEQWHNLVIHSKNYLDSIFDKLRKHTQFLTHFKECKHSSMKNFTKDCTKCKKDKFVKATLIRLLQRFTC